MSVKLKPGELKQGELKPGELIQGGLRGTTNLTGADMFTSTRKNPNVCLGSRPTLFSW